MPYLFLAATFLAMYLLVIRPQQRRVKAHQVIVATLEVGHEVMTTAGLHGTLTALDDETAHLEVAPGVVLRFARGAIARDLTQEAVAEAELAADPARRPRRPGTAADRAPSLRADGEVAADAGPDDPERPEGDER